ncbi:MAG: hypothetical protein COC16_02580 [Lutibacter sp.]|nr:MAG: hypothetical protein COC16_02580 [Lutibacter sp.]
MKTLQYLIKTIALLAIVLGCTNNSETSQETDLLELKDLKDEIDLLISQSICADNNACDFLTFGSKACGGPKEYLVFSNSINVADLEVKVTSYNALEKIYNMKWDIVSDCMFVLPPTNVECINGECTAIY